MAIRFDNIEAINLLNNQGEQTIALTNDQGIIVSGNVAMASGNATGKFAVKSAGVHASYDFYNDGTSYFNGAVTVDAGLSQTGGADASFSGDVLPMANGGSNLGSSSKQWGSIYAGGIAVGTVTPTTIHLNGSFNILNKAQNAYIGFATRNTSGSQTVMDLTNVGSATFSGNVTHAGVTTFLHGSTSNRTTFAHGNEINTETATGADAVMYLNYRSGAVNIGNGKLIVGSSGSDSTFAGNVTLSSTAPILYLANTTSSTGKTWRLSSAANGNAYITQDSVIDAITLSHTSGNATFAGDITSAGLTVDYTGNRTGDAGILVTNDNSDWGIKVDKDGTADYGILSQTDGENAIVVRNAAGVNKIQLQGDGDASFEGDISASNFSGSSSGTNTGDQTLPTASSLGAVTLTGTQTISGAKTFSSAANHYNGHLYYDAYDAAGNHYPHFKDGSESGGTTINWRQSYGSSYKTHTWASDASGNMTFTFQGDIDANGGDISADNFSGSSSGTNTGDQDLSGYLTSLPSHNHDDRYYTETEINTKYTTTDGSGDEWKFTLGDESNLTGNKWYRVAIVNQGSGGLHIKGSLSNHVESFGTQKVDLLIQGREANEGQNIEITGTVDVLNNATGTSTDKAGIRVIKSAVGTYYDTYTIYIRTTRYSQAKFHLTKFGGAAFYTSKPSVTTEPAPVSGGNVEIDTSTLVEGNYVVDDSTPREIYHEGHKPTYTELGTMAYTNLTGTPTLGNITTADSDTNAFFAVPFVSTTAGSGVSVHKDANNFYYNPNTNNLQVGLLDLSSYGTAAAPAIRWSGDGDTGMYRSAANALGFSTSGTLALTLDASQNATFAGKMVVGDATNQHQWIVNKAVSGYYSGIKLTRGAGNNSNAANNNHAIWVSDTGLNFGKTNDATVDSFSNVSTHLTLNASGNATFAGDVNVGVAATNGASIRLIHPGSSENPEIRIQSGESGVTAFSIYNTATDPDAPQFFINNTLGSSHLGNKRGALKLETSSGVALTLSGSAATFAGDVTTGGDINVPEYVVHDGDTNTHIRFTADRIRLVAGGTTKFDSNSPYITGLDWTEIAGDPANINISGFNNDSGYLTAHPNITAASSSDNSGRTYIQDITVDSNGHVTGIATATETVTNTNTEYSAGTGLDLSGTTFSIESDLRDGVTRIGKDTSNYIAIGADTNVIDFHVGGVWVARMESYGDLHMKGDVIAFSDIFNP
jgi:hypothetical protein